MEKKLKEYLETELHYTRVGIMKENDVFRLDDICWYARQRGLGATQFANSLGLDYGKAEAVFDWYQGEIEEMKNIALGLGNTPRCELCYNADQDTTDKVAACNCCENYSFFTSR